MQSHLNYSKRVAFRFKMMSGALICSLLFTLMPRITMAQDGKTPLYLPNISGGLAKDAESAGSIEGFDDAPEEKIESDLMVEASAQLPEPPPPVAASERPQDEQDFDADGVPNGADLCPHQPNPPLNGVQPDFCGKGLVQQIDNYVFLQSRIFPPVTGLDPALKNTQKGARIHVLLHLIPNPKGVMLTSQQRLKLQSLGVTLIEYLPENTY